MGVLSSAGDTPIKVATAPADVALMKSLRFITSDPVVSEAIKVVE
jgi:hypothetical protein